MKLIVRNFKTAQDYTPTWEAMKAFNANRKPEQADELWLMEHKPVFTQGQAGKAEHVLNPHEIPIVQTDRGGQVTYHGPGQLMLYTLFDVQRLGLNTRSLVRTLEEIVVDYLSSLGITAQNNPDAPGIYTDGAKICSIGLRLRKYCAYHGLALNASMDLTPFSYINPCGFKGLKMSQIKDFRPELHLAEIKEQIIPYFSKHLGYNQTDFLDALPSE